MEQTIKINVPEGKVAKYNEVTKTIEFIDKEPVRSKSWEEFCKNHPVIQNEWLYDSFNNLCFQHNTPRTTKSLLSSKEDAEGVLALIQLVRLHDEWVGDWTPNWEDSSIFKHCIYTYGNNTLPALSCFEYHLLSFPSKKLTVEFFECFKDLILKAKKFL